MKSFIVLLEKITREDQQQIIIHGVETPEDAAKEARRITGQSVVEVKQRC
jgi:hypothetical protein